MTPYDFVRQQNIFDCNTCPEIIHLQINHNINVCPLFWQGKGVENLPLVIMGGNPSVVGTPNEPRCGERDFDYYFDYYQNRSQSERINKIQARTLGITTPQAYWGRSYKLAQKLIVDRKVERWKDYVLMEAIHCFYDRENDLDRVQRASVARTCFNKHTRDMLLFLKPKMMVLLGDLPYGLLNQLGYLEGLAICKFGRMEIEGNIDGENINLSIPVMRHRAPNFYGPFYCDDEVYQTFREFAGFNGAQP